MTEAISASDWKNVMITGGAGFIGSHVVDLFTQGNYNVLVLDNFSTGKLENIPERDNLQVILMDIANPKDVLGAFLLFKPDIVIHLAAQSAITTAMQDPLEDLRVNGAGTLNMLCHSVNAEVDRFVYASTSAVYGDRLTLPMPEYTREKPDNYYGVSKLCGEKYCNMMDVPTTILRFGNVYGPRQVPIGENQVIARMMRHLVYGDEFFIFGNGNQRRDFVYVEDVAKAVYRAATHPDYSMRKVFNVSSGKSHSINQVAVMLSGLYGYRDRWMYKPSRLDERQNVCMEIDKIKKALNWRPETDLETGLKNTIQWWKATRA